MNVWNRALFDALEQKNAAGVLYQALIYVPLLVGSVFFAVINVYVQDDHAAPVARVADQPTCSTAG